MIDVIKWTQALEDPLDLTKLTYVTASVMRLFDVGALELEANFVGLMIEITRDNMMAARTQLRDQSCTDYP